MQHFEIIKCVDKKMVFEHVTFTARVLNQSNFFPQNFTLFNPDYLFIRWSISKQSFDSFSFYFFNQNDIQILGWTKRNFSLLKSFIFDVFVFHFFHEGTKYTKLQINHRLQSITTSISIICGL